MFRTARRIWRHPANCDRRVRRIAGWLAWQGWERVVRRPWVVTMPPDLAIELAPHDPVSSAVLYCGLPDWPEMPFLADYVRRGDLVVDVGANVGLYSLLAARAGARVIAFEPNRLARERAAANFARNGLTVDLRPHAVGAAAGRSRFTTGLGPENRIVGDTDIPPTGTAVDDVDIVSLDEQVELPVAVLKVDVEGYEDGVLAGADRILRVWRPALILEANDPAGLTRRLDALGYRWVTYEPGARLLRLAERPPRPRENGIAVADLDAASARLAGPDA